MIDKPLNQLNEFFKLAEERTLSGSDQLLYLHLLQRFNRAHWTETVNVSDRDLLNSMRLYDSTGKPAHVNTIRNARSRLKLKGFINFKSGQGKETTEYRLIQLYPCDTACDTPEHSAKQTPCDTAAPSLINNAREDVKDVKTLRPLNKEKEERAREIPVSPQVLKAWQDYAGTKILNGTRQELHELEGFFGIDAVAKAIRNVYKVFNNVNIELVQGNLYGKGRNKKGSEMNARNVIDFRNNAGGQPDWVDIHPSGK